MVKRIRDDAVYVTGISFDTPIESVQELFGAVGTIRVRRLRQREGWGLGQSELLSTF